MGSCLSQIQALLPAAFDVAMLVSRELRRVDGSASVSPASHQLGLVSAYKNYSKSGEPAFTNFKANFRGACHESCLHFPTYLSSPPPAKCTGTAMYKSSHINYQVAWTISTLPQFRRPRPLQLLAASRFHWKSFFQSRLRRLQACALLFQARCFPVITCQLPPG
jgi:hypothetical protein